MENELTSLPNIGKILADRLHEVGIETTKEFLEMGSEAVFIRLHTVDSRACLHELMALEGAVQGIRWHELDANRKTELKLFHQQVQAGSK